MEKFLGSTNTFREGQRRGEVGVAVESLRARISGRIRTNPHEPIFLTVDETGEILRTTRKAVYAMVARNAVPGITRIGRRVLIHRRDLLDWLHQKRASSLKEYQR